MFEVEHFRSYKISAPWRIVGPRESRLSIYEYHCVKRALSIKGQDKPNLILSAVAFKDCSPVFRIAHAAILWALAVSWDGHEVTIKAQPTITEPSQAERWRAFKAFMLHLEEDEGFVSVGRHRDPA